MLPWGSYFATSAFSAAVGVCNVWYPDPVRLVGLLLDGLEVDVRAGIARSVERERLRVGELVGVRRVRAQQVLERPEPRQRHRHRPPLRGAEGAVLGADVVISGLPSAPLRWTLFPVLVGRTSPEGLPTVSRVAVGTESAATTWGESAVVPVSAGADEPPVPPVPVRPVAERCDDAEAGGLEFPAALITTMVAMAATTSPTGTSAASTGWRERNRVGGALALAWAWVWDRDDALDLGPGRVVGEFFWRSSCWSWWAAADATAPMGTSTWCSPGLRRARRQGTRARRLETEAARRLPGLHAGGAGAGRPRDGAAGRVAAR